MAITLFIPAGQNVVSIACWTVIGECGVSTESLSLKIPSKFFEYNNFYDGFRFHGKNNKIKFIWIFSYVSILYKYIVRITCKYIYRMFIDLFFSKWQMKNWKKTKLYCFLRSVMLYQKFFLLLLSFENRRWPSIFKLNFFIFCESGYEDEWRQCTYSMIFQRFTEDQERKKYFEYCRLI